MFANHDNSVLRQQNSQEAAWVLTLFDNERELSPARRTIYLLTTSTFDLGILPLIIEYLQPVIDQESFFKILKEYHIWQTSRGDFTVCDASLKNGLGGYALQVIATHGNMGCMNFLLENYPECKSGISAAIEGAAENRYTFIIERLLEITDEDKKPDLIGKVFKIALTRQDFGVFKWLILRHRNDLENFEQARLAREETFPAGNKSPDIQMRIRARTISTYGLDKTKNPFIALYEDGRVIRVEEPKIEVIEEGEEEKKGTSLESTSSVSSSCSMSSSSSSSSPAVPEEPVPSPHIDAKSSVVSQSSSCPCSLFLKMISAVSATGGILLLIILHTPVGIAVGVTSVCVGGLAFFAANREKKKEDILNAAAIAAHSM